MFNQAIALRVVGGHGVDAHAQDFHGRGEGAVGELDAMVSDNVSRDAKLAELFGHEGISDGGGVYGGERACFQPPGEAVAAGQQVLESLALRQGTDEVDVDSVELVSWGWKLSWRRLEMFWNLD